MGQVVERERMTEVVKQKGNDVQHRLDDTGARRSPVGGQEESYAEIDPSYRQANETAMNKHTEDLRSFG